MVGTEIFDTSTTLVRPKGREHRPCTNYAVKYATARGHLTLAGAKTHPKTQHTRKRKYPTVPRICDFGCVAFSGVFWRPLRREQRAPENATHPKTQIPGTVDHLRFRVVLRFRVLCSSLILNIQDKNARVSRPQEVGKKNHPITGHCDQSCEGAGHAASRPRIVRRRAPKPRKNQSGQKIGQK